MLAGVCLVQCGPAAADYRHLRRVPIVDMAGFEKPVAAGTIVVPADWQGEGGVVWRTDPCVRTYFATQLTVRSPDGTRSLNIHDIPGWHYSSNPQPSLPGAPACTATPYRGLGDFFAGYVPTMAGDARILQTRERPEIVEEARVQGLIPPQPPQMPGLTMQNWAEAGEALIAFTANGVDYRADLVCLLFMSSAVIDMAGSQMAGAPDVAGVHHEELYGVPVCVSQAAPDGQLDFDLTEMFRKSYRPSPEWLQRISQFGSNIAKINQKGIADRFQITTQNAGEMNQIISDIGQNQSDSFDRTSRAASESILGLQTFNDPTTGQQVQLDNTYSHNWALNDGTFIQSNDPNFNPNVDLGVTATELTPAE